MIPQVFAGWAASRFGAKWFLIVTFFVNSLVGTDFLLYCIRKFQKCLLSGLSVPFIAAYLGSKGLMLGRAVQGFCQGFIYPSLTHLLSQWVPTEERSRLGTIVYAGW